MTAVRGKPFQKGQSGNPGGMKKAVVNGVHVPTLAKEYGPEAIRVLAEIMGNKDCPPPARVKAAEVLLDRGFGKAPAIVHNVNHKAARDLTDDELVAYLTPAESNGASVGMH